MSRHFSVPSFSNLNLPQVIKRNSYPNGYLKSSLRKSSVLNSFEDIPSLTSFDNDVFLKAYNTAKRKTVIISTALDANIRGCIRKSIRNAKLKCTPGNINEALRPLLDKIEEYETEQQNLRKINYRKKTNSNFSNYSNGCSKPRFGSLLSKDGQYALLKSYEDIIFNELQSLYPELKNHLERTKTANLKDRLRRSSNSSDVSDASSQNTYDDSSRRASNESTQSDNSIHSPNDTNRLRYSLTSSQSFFDLNELNGNNDAETEKKLKITHQLEYAMELIDNLKLIKASKKNNNNNENINLRKIIENPAESVSKYNEWRNEWTELIDLN